MSTQVLCIEDEEDIALAIRMVLRRAGFDVVCAADGKEGLRAFHAERPDVVLLDIGLPTMDGREVLERIRDLSDVPVIILTAHGQESDKVHGLALGADDYLTKPFGNAELVARVQALLRRSRPSRPEAEVYADAIIQLNFAAREVRIGDEVVALTPSEFRLLAALVRHAGQTLSPDQLLEQAWNDPMRVGPERVKFAIMRLRRKLGQGESTGPPIEAVRGFGYRYVAPSAGWQAKQAAGRPAADAVSRDSRTPQPRRPASPTLPVSSDADPGSRN
jgi:DNA-binding response OmpR family regulator